MRILELDARVWLGEASRRERRPVTLGGVSPPDLDGLVDLGFEAVRLRGIWELDDDARQALRRQAGALEELGQALPDLELADIDGSPLGPGRHRVRADLGGEDGLELLREDLARRGMQLLLDLSLDWLSAAGANGPDCLDDIAALADGLCVVRTGVDGGAPGAAWLGAALARVRSIHPRFLVLAEGPARTPGAGEDAVFDHELFHALVARDPLRVRASLNVAASSPRSRVRFLEEYGGPRARELFPGPELQAASLVAYLPPGIRLFRDGCREGRRSAFEPRLRRRRDEDPDPEVAAFHDTLFELMASGDAIHGAGVRPVRPAWEENDTHEQIVAVLQGIGPGRLLAVNYGPQAAQCYVDLSPLEPAGKQWLFQDLMSLAVYERDGDDLAGRGLYLDLAPWDYNVFDVRAGKSLK